MSPLVGAHNEPGGIWKGEPWEEEMQGGGLIHQWCLAGWGKPILPLLIQFPGFTKSRRHDRRDV